LTGANTVVLNVNVSTTGTYSITTAAVNGIQFAGTGTFSATGPQTVTLTGSGTPAAAGTNNYTANAGGTNTCIFSVPVNPAPNQDYFPLTQNSWWSYDSDYTSPDSLYKKNTTLVTFSGNSYRRIEINANTVPYDTVFYRKSGNDYYQRIMVDSFTNFYLDVLQFGEMIFLKENAPAGTNWNSAVFSGTVVGTPVLLRYNYNIVSVTTTITVNGVTYNNVIKVDSKSQYSIDAGVTYVDNVATESWYAKGVGLIKFHQYLISNPAQSLVDDLRYYQVF
jgi:hypothetical protein